MWILYLILFFIVLKIYFFLTCGICSSNADLKDKVVVITGANTGIGYETAKDLVKKGAKVIIGCRDETKGQEAVRRIIRETGNDEIIFQQLDLSSLQSVREFVKNIKESQSKVHILINNAGTGKLDNSLTKDNLPIEMQVNHFAPFCLTTLMLPLLIDSAPSRIINVSSIMHYLGKIDIDKIDKPASSSLEHSRVYSNSKLANILFTKELARRLAGTGVTANCLHPGAVNTEIFRNQPRIYRFLMGLLFKSPLEGAQSTIQLAVDPELQDISGEYFSDCKAGFIVPLSPARLIRVAGDEL